MEDKERKLVEDRYLRYQENLEGILDDTSDFMKSLSRELVVLHLYKQLDRETGSLFGYLEALRDEGLITDEDVDAYEEKALDCYDDAEVSLDHILGEAGEKCRSSDSR